MTAKEKAKELVQLFYNNQCSHSVTELAYNSAKQCALIYVDEIIKFAYDVEWEKKEDALSKIKFLKEVKQEINKL